MSYFGVLIVPRDVNGFCVKFQKCYLEGEVTTLGSILRQFVIARETDIATQHPHPKTELSVLPGQIQIL